MRGSKKTLNKPSYWWTPVKIPTCLCWGRFLMSLSDCLIPQLRSRHQTPSHNGSVVRAPQDSSRRVLKLNWNIKFLTAAALLIVGSFCYHYQKVRSQITHWSHIGFTATNFQTESACAQPGISRSVIAPWHLFFIFPHDWGLKMEIMNLGENIEFQKSSEIHPWYWATGWFLLTVHLKLQINESSLMIGLFWSCLRH